MTLSDSLQRSVERQWYGRPTWLWLLLPLSFLYRLLSKWRRNKQQKAAQRSRVPIVVVGNISVGGTGKTPLIIALVKYLQAQGFSPGVISRGYGGSASDEGSPLLILGSTKADVAGDEPLLIAQSTRCPVVVGRNRLACVAKLEQDRSCNIILSDDGMQHYKLYRHLEIAVVDADRLFGNGWCLPLGPLREPVSRLSGVDWVVVNGLLPDITELKELEETQAMSLKPRSWMNVKTGELLGLDTRPWQSEGGAQAPLAIAGIGNPARFFRTLQQLNIGCECKAFADHQAYSIDTFMSFTGRPLLMTVKDAVKCTGFAQENWWALVVEAELSPSFLEAFRTKLISVME